MKQKTVITMTEDTVPWITTPALFAQYCSQFKWIAAEHLILLSDTLIKVARGEIDHLMISMPPRHGKALALDTPIPTPTGWTTIGALDVGDQVFSDTGEVCHVIAKSPIWHNRPVFKVYTDTMDHVVADSEHEWVVRLCRKRPVYKSKTTAYLANRTSPRNPQMKPIGGLKLPPQELPIDPYVLGVWLGDGCTYSSSIWSPDDEIINEIERLEGGIIEYENRNGAVHFRPGPNFRKGATKSETLQGRLRELGLIGNKHIPMIYLRSSQKQRLSLLQGLVDTDGYVANDGQVEFSSTNRILAEQCRELVNSLGIKASLIMGRAVCNGKDCGEKYRVMFYMRDAARISRKASRTRNNERSPGTYLTFEPAGYADTVCIEVDSPSHQFLCGRTLIPTHNSELTSKYFPAWFLGHNPDKRVILTSYEADFAATWGRKARNVLAEYGPALFGTRVASKSSAVNRWDIENYEGGMSTAGVGGAITGKGCDILIIDDPHKNAEEANSKTYRDKAAEWYRSTAYTRLEPGGAVIIIQTRWHMDDLSGRLLTEEPEKWTVLNLPALAEESDPLGRKSGEALFPKRYSVEDLLEIKQTLGSYWWNALYQQRPQALEGGTFKRQYFKYAKLEDGIFTLADSKKVKYQDCRIFQTCDPAASTKTTADYFVLSTWSRTPDNDLILLDVLRSRLEGPDQINLFKQQYHRWDPVFQAVESVGLGKTLYQMLVREGLPVRELKADRDKVTRALPAAARMEAGAVYFMHGPWLTDFEDELLSFPTGAHDDQVDTLSYAVQMTVKQRTGKLDLSALIKTRAR
jgi:predicted phage terminase large subunit-like protein